MDDRRARLIPSSGAAIPCGHGRHDRTTCSAAEARPDPRLETAVHGSAQDMLPDELERAHVAAHATAVPRTGQRARRSAATKHRRSLTPCWPSWARSPRARVVIGGTADELAQAGNDLDLLVIGSRG
jgi:hypothetical protein